ncbi:Hypothetical protein IALB_2938 [Ignavibacterium album JCM 16511]|uniref:Uncharacterized protein n=1 Tax=Ignavibacterium album (strain DSM 19864 / JCM 16511 / NBRC 101810 / Mat9-16) TaxID=945713 RepID=I0ANT4_IGNAJ|nr:hypothetical protein [Ignavibacterium album]AFH50641.1 Hypothetical protein IALB_2938 [Ignavibacterium album JCM 16511]
MKESIILWTGTVIIVFLLSYFKSVFGEYYPITGTFSIDGQKISYKLDKIEFGDFYKLIIRTDYENLEGQVIINSEKVKNYTIKLNEDDRILFAEIRKKDVGNNFNYSLILNGKDKVYRIPNEGEVKFVLFGKIPKMLNWLYVLFLYSGLILIIRSGLEQFKTNRRTKNFLVITSIVLLTFTMMINPLYLSYKFEYINKSIPPIQNLFPINFLFITLLWIGVTIYVFTKRKDKPMVLFTSIICLLIYLFT